MSLSVLTYGQEGRQLLHVDVLGRATPCASNVAKTEGALRIVCVACTHGQELSLEWPEGDLLIHCGDLRSPRSRQSGGRAWELEQWHLLAERFAQVRPRYPLGLLFTGGNHDFLPSSDLPSFLAVQGAFASRGLVFGVDDLVHVQVPGHPPLRVFLSPLSAYRGNRSCAFQAHCRCEAPERRQRDRLRRLPRDSDIISGWPVRGQLDILVTHGPPLGIGDERPGMPGAWEGAQSCTGSDGLWRYVAETQPKYHLFGDFHGDEDGVHGHGVKMTDVTGLSSCCINCAVGQNDSAGAKSIRRGCVLLDFPLEVLDPAMTQPHNCIMPPTSYRRQNASFRYSHYESVLFSREAV